MKNLILLVMLFIAHMILGQSVPKPTFTPPAPPDWKSMIPRPVGDYMDTGTAVATFSEAWMTKMVEAAHTKTVREIGQSSPTAVAENFTRSYVNPVRQEVLGISYLNLCDGFVGGALNRKQRLCVAKRTYILEASKVVNDLVYAGTRFKVNNGIVDQIAEKYTGIINTLRYELQQMEIEKERRGIISRIIR